jgi:hypothetical protein
MKELHDWKVCYRASRVFASIDLDSWLRRTRRSRARMHFEDEIMRDRHGAFAGTSGFRSASVQIPPGGHCLYSYTFLFDFVLDTTTHAMQLFCGDIILKLLYLHAFATLLDGVLST